MMNIMFHPVTLLCALHLNTLNLHETHELLQELHNSGQNNDCGTICYCDQITKLLHVLYI